MNRIAGIVLVAIGLILAVVSVLGILPGQTATGVMLIVLGGLVIGLSFISKPETEGVEKQPTASTLGNIFFAPAETFGNLRNHPRWLAAVLIMSVLAGVYSNLFVYRLGAERVANYAIDKTLQMSILNDQARSQIDSGRKDTIEQAKDPIVRTGQAISTAVWSIIGYAFLAAIFFLFILALGGTINFWQAFSAVVYAAFPVAVIRFVLNTVILFIKDPGDVHPILGQSSLVQDNLGFLVSPGENPVIYVLLASFSLLGFYWIWLNAVGLKNAGERVSSTSGWTASISVYVAFVLFGVLMALIFPSFMS